MELTGIIKAKSEIKKISDKFSVQEFYLDASTFHQFTGEKYENMVKLQLTNQRIKLLDQHPTGTRVKVSFAPQGRFYEYEGEKRHAQHLNVWKIERVHQNGALTQTQDQPKSEEDNVIDDLPF